MGLCSLPGAAMDDDLLGRIIRTFGLPVAGWAAFCAIIVHWWRNRNERLRDAASENASDREFLRAERDHALEEAERLRAMLIECERVSIERLGRAVTAEAILQGYGEADQRLAIRLAAERLALQNEKKPGDGND